MRPHAEPSGQALVRLPWPSKADSHCPFGHTNLTPDAPEQFRPLPG
jgi:hypothetical protein